jgi:lysophospholipid acyltransferase (LPLAT)-like uncharacterized protein
MSLTKRLLKHDRTQKLLSWLLSLYIRLVMLSSRKTRHVDQGAQKYLRGEDNAIFAFWHGRMMMLPAFCPPSHQMRVLISFHRDGLLISRVIHHFGQATISGSSSKGGAGAVKEILRSLKQGDNISITPDGPRGPAQVAEMGIVTVAKISGRPVIPVTFSSTWHIRFRSWDRFMLALPFGRIVFCVGQPIVVSKESDAHTNEQARRMIEQEMNRLVEKADGMAHV